MLLSDLVPSDGPSAYPRGVSWSDANFPGSRILFIHDHDGELLMEMRVRADLASPDLERRAWAWLDEHDPLEAPRPTGTSPVVARYAPLRLL